MNKLYIATPSLGVSKYLTETMSSVFAMPDSKHVFIAPGQVAEGLKREYPSSSVVVEGGQKGIYFALNQSIEDFLESGCSHYTYINDDDVLAPGFMETWSEIRSGHRRESIYYGGVDFIDSTGSRICAAPIVGCPQLAAYCMRRGVVAITQQGVVFPRSVFARGLRFDTSYKLCADTDLLRKIALFGSEFNYSARIHAQYRLHYGQLSGQQVLQDSEMKTMRNRAGVKRAEVMQACIFMKINNFPLTLRRIWATRTLRAADFFANPTR